MRKDITVAAEPRAVRGKNEMNRLRMKGMSPAVVYGVGGDPVAIAVNPKDITKILHSVTGHNTIFNVSVRGGETSPVMIVDWQMDPVKDFLLHSDLKRIDLAKRIAVKVPVHPVGDPVGVKLQGGQHEIINREIEIECLPDDIPEFFEENIAGLNIGQALRAGQVRLKEGMTLLSDPQMVVSHVVATRTSDVAAAAADGAADGKAEPEVVKAKGKKEEEGGAPAPAKKK
jgi:large subunit ribosomal protein L25